MDAYWWLCLLFVVVLLAALCYLSMYFCIYSVLFFFFKQKTAYEMRISDWSSDVCSSDLHRPGEARGSYVSAPGFSACPLGDIIFIPAHQRSEERRVGKECVSTCRSRWSPYH